MRTLLCVSDFPYTAPTVRFGGMVVELLKSEVTLMTVRSPSEDPAVGDGILDQAEELLPIRPSERLICQGLPEEQILDVLSSQNYNLVVVGSSQPPALAHLFLGMMTRRLVTQTNVSILVVCHPMIQLKNILLASGGHEASDPTVMTGARLAQLSGAKVTLVHVTGISPGMYAGLSRMEETLPELLRSETPASRHLRDNITLLRSQGIEAQLELRHGVPVEEILRATRRYEPDLLVIGASKPKGLSRFWLDEVAPKIVEHTPRPVLVVRGQLDE